MTLLKKIAGGALCIAGTTTAALAQSASTAYDPTNDINSIRDTLTGWLGNLTAPMVVVVTAGLAIWFIPKLVRYFKSAWNGGTGK